MHYVVPAKAGTHTELAGAKSVVMNPARLRILSMGSRLRGNDGEKGCVNR
jgi:hypothetical protein